VAKKENRKMKQGADTKNPGKGSHPHMQWLIATAALIRMQIDRVIDSATK
jgi:hypothetical protein